MGGERAGGMHVVHQNEGRRGRTANGRATYLRKSETTSAPCPVLPLSLLRRTTHVYFPSSFAPSFLLRRNAWRPSDDVKSLHQFHSSSSGYSLVGTTVTFYAPRNII